MEPAVLTITSEGIIVRPLGINAVVNRLRNSQRNMLLALWIIWVWRHRNLEYSGLMLKYTLHSLNGNSPSFGNLCNGIVLFNLNCWMFNVAFV